MEVGTDAAGAAPAAADRALWFLEPPQERASDPRCAAPRGAKIPVAQTRRLRSEDEGMAIASRYFATVRRAT
jgi:hypothetical protein